jgi:3-hydroxyisobutyrate dehydrogenase-like beta-hydroxyacid dehydrogenase
MKEKIGFIGLGILGSAITENLVKAGFHVTGYDINSSVLSKVAEFGVLKGSSPMDVAMRSDVVLTCLSSIDAMLEVYGGSKGINKANKANQTIIELGTFPIDIKEKVRIYMDSCNKNLLDCPVSGNRILAKKKQLTAFGSGEENTYNKVVHIISSFAHRAFYVGAFGNGMKMKFCANILNLVHNSVAAEVMVLGMKSGLDAEIIHSVISGSGSSSSMFETRGAMMAKNNYEYEGMNFSIPIKDSRFISDHAHQMRVPTPIYHVALQSYYAAVAQGHSDEDAAAVCAAMERAANIERPKNRRKKNEF